MNPDPLYPQNGPSSMGLSVLAGQIKAASELLRDAHAAALAGGLFDLADKIDEACRHTLHAAIGTLDLAISRRSEELGRWQAPVGN